MRGATNEKSFFRPSLSGNAVPFSRQVFDRDDVKGIKGYDFSISIKHTDGVGANKNQLRMADGIFVAIGSAQSERLEAATFQPAPNPFHIHIASLRRVGTGVNQGT
jgi:hypothetical protein